MESRFDFTTIETKIYQLWVENDCFNPDTVNIIKANKTDKPYSSPFCIIMPPPNANDPLHIGHGLFVTIEDIFVRFHRMLGNDTLWLPGTDHAGIETQYVFEKKLQKEGKSRFQFDRQTLYQKIWDYVQENSDIAVSQIKKLGASADWSRFAFSLEPRIVEQVYNTFKKLHEDGLVYRDLRLTNYCTKCGTSYSDLEVVYQERVAPLYYVKYLLKGDSQQFVEVATVRPEPIFVDTHLAVHPHSPAHQILIGKKVVNPLTQREMEIIADDFVDPEFGTGIVKLTPAHDFNDFGVAQKHQLPIVQGINQQGKIMENGGKYAGLNIQEARQRVVEDLINNGMINQSKTNLKYSNRVGTCYRCGRVLEPLPMSQFFIKVNDSNNSLTKRALNALSSGETIVHGAGREKILRHWLNNLNDWNISRQIVWGIQLPVWYEVGGNEKNISVRFIDSDSKKLHQGTLKELFEQGFGLEEVVRGVQQLIVEPSVPFSISATVPSPTKQWIRETDTFDTWFSSAQWPFLTLKTSPANKKNKISDFDRFYPTAVMETAYDILPFWVMRMMMLGLYLTNKSPFTNVYLHGLIRDSNGQKMSKSKGNVINPISIIESYGADALRLALVIRSTAGIDKSVGEPDFKAARNLANKVWNASRFVILQPNLEDIASQQKKLVSDQQFIDKLNEVIEEATKHLLELRPGQAADLLYNEFWHWFCDQAIEEYKKEKLSYSSLLLGLTTFLKMLHPFLPFVTESIWQELRGKKAVDEELLIVADWPSRVS